MFFLRLFITLALIFNGTIAFAQELKGSLTYRELVKSAEVNCEDAVLKEKQEILLNTPIVDNTISKQNEIVNKSPILGDFIRVASWNIARGRNIDLIKMVFTDTNKLIEKIESANPKGLSKKELKEIKEQAEILKNIDILLVNEADIGMPRTGYKNIPEELAQAMGFNYAYGVEFLEVDPVHLGIEDYKWSEEQFLFPNETYTVNKDNYKGLHGNAILSRYPLQNVRIIRLPACYNWFKDERDRVVEIEYLRRKAADILFNEAIFREIRIGGRMALLADVQIPGLDKPVTVISVHLENRTVPSGRYKQIKALFENIKDINNPVVIGGDFNTTTGDGRPTTIKRELKKKITDVNFIGKQVVHVLLPYTIAVSAGQIATDVIRKHNNPTVLNIPVISPNKERKLFVAVKEMKFSDGGRFDYGGQRYKAVYNKDGPLSNSNQRSNLKGFVPTFLFERDWYLGKFKLDWFFIKPDKETLSPFFARTMHNLNHSMLSPISDHSPITVDLSINTPGKKEVKFRKKELKRQEKSIEKQKE